MIVMDSDELPVEDDADSELIALMQVEDRATIPELLGDSPLIPEVNPSEEPYLEAFPTNIFAPMLS